MRGNAGTNLAQMLMQGGQGIAGARGNLAQGLAQMGMQGGAGMANMATGLGQGLANVGMQGGTNLANIIQQAAMGQSSNLMGAAGVNSQMAQSMLPAYGQAAAGAGQGMANLFSGVNQGLGGMMAGLGQYGYFNPQTQPQPGSGWDDASMTYYG